MATGKANKIQASTFNIDLSEQYQLAVQIGLKHFSYCIINSTTNNVEYFNNFIVNDDMINIINREKNLKLNFASSTVAFNNFPCALVPNELFLKKNAKEILELTSNVYDIIKTDALTEIKAHLVYTIPSVISDIVFTFFPNAKQKAQQSILVKQFSKFDNKDDHAYLYINDNILNITAFKNGKLIFNNSFSFDTKEDILYFTLFAFEQLKLDAETVNVTLYGEIIKGDENHQLLYEYIRNIDFGSRPNNLTFSSAFNKLKKHQFYGLFSQTI
ncbi:MAG: DUF3822 family protein [Bacteroidota bacterium]|nr:DUF3822 family protein [Bacteroidota bacterium]MEC9209788.1 DUF3822 family protein [Bacteroidota bacterium]